MAGSDAEQDRRKTPRSEYENLLTQIIGYSPQQRALLRKAAKFARETLQELPSDTNFEEQTSIEKARLRFGTFALYMQTMNELGIFDQPWAGKLGFIGMLHLTAGLQFHEFPPEDTES